MNLNSDERNLFYSDKLQKIYARELAPFSPLTRAEEVQLAERIMQGCLEARNILVQCNMGFVFTMARQYHRPGISLSDLVSEAVIGSLKAAASFQPGKGAKYISYAVVVIRQGLLKYLDISSSVIDRPYGRSRDDYKFKRFRDMLTQHLEREPTDKELAGYAEVDESYIADIRKFGNSTAYFDDIMSGSEDETDTKMKAYRISQRDEAIEQYIEQEHQSWLIRRILGGLTETERDIIKLYFGLDSGFCMSDWEIGLKYEKTAQWSQMARSKALKKIRQHFAILGTKPNYCTSR